MTAEQFQAWAQRVVNEPPRLSQPLVVGPNMFKRMVQLGWITPEGVPVVPVVPPQVKEDV